MNTTKICSQLNDVKKLVCTSTSGWFDQGTAMAAAAYAAVCAWFAGLVISEALLLKTFLISVGVLIGSLFSDFFKKHRGLVIFVMCASLALFLYKVFTEICEEEF